MTKTIFSRRLRYEEESFHYGITPNKPEYGWSFKFLKKRYRVYVYDDLFSVNRMCGEMINRLFVVKLTKTKQACARDIIYLFEPFGKPSKQMREKVKTWLTPHIKKHLSNER